VAGHWKKGYRFGSANQVQRYLISAILPQHVICTEESPFDKLRRAPAKFSLSLTLSLKGEGILGKSDTTGKAGGLTVAGPSKGPDRNRWGTSLILCPSFRRRPESSAFFWFPAFAGMTNATQKTFLELSNFMSPPAKPGVYLKEISANQEKV
jgi:hypothetical protein